MGRGVWGWHNFVVFGSSVVSQIDWTQLTAIPGLIQDLCDYGIRGRVEGWQSVLLIGGRSICLYRIFFWRFVLEVKGSYLQIFKKHIHLKVSVIFK